MINYQNYPGLKLLGHIWACLKYPDHGIAQLYRDGYQNSGHGGGMMKRRGVGFLSPHASGLAMCCLKTGCGRWNGSIWVGDYQRHVTGALSFSHDRAAVMWGLSSVRIVTVI